MCRLRNACERSRISNVISRHMAYIDNGASRTQHTSQSRTNGRLAVRIQLD